MSQTIPARRAGHGEATWTVAGSPGTWDQMIKLRAADRS